MSFTKSAIAIALSLSFLSACSEQKNTPTNEVTTEQTATKDVSEVAATESEKANKLFDEIFMEGVNRSPIFQTYLGIKTDYDKWNDLSEANAEKELNFTKSNLERI